MVLLSIMNIFDSFKFAFNGLQTVWKEERNFRLGVFISIIVVAVIIYFKFSFVESAFCIIAMTMVLSAEIVNTAVEDICNKIEPNQDPMIAKIKDISSSLALVSVIGAFIIAVLVFYNHFL